MKRVTYKQRGDDSFMIEIKAKPSKSSFFRKRKMTNANFPDSFDQLQREFNRRSLNTQEGDE